jgi:hypothetical protein
MPYGSEQANNMFPEEPKLRLFNGFPDQSTISGTSRLLGKAMTRGWLLIQGGWLRNVFARGSSQVGRV